MKYVILVIHAALLVLAKGTLNLYHDFFLLVSLAVLLMILGYALLGRQSIWRSHLLGSAFQLVILYSLDIHAGAFGLGGGPIAAFLYSVVLAVSCVLVPLLELLGRSLR